MSLTVDPDPALVDAARTVDTGPVGGPILLPRPPVLPDPLPGGWLTTLLPALSACGSVGVVLVGGLTATSGALVGLVVASSLGMALSGAGGRRRERRRRILRARADFLRRLDVARQEASRAREAQRRQLLLRHPGPWSGGPGRTARVGTASVGAPPVGAASGGALPAGAVPVDEVIGELRIGTGSVPPQRPLLPIAADAEHGEPDPVAVAAVARLVREHSSLPGVPVTMPVVAGDRFVITGEDPPALVRALLLQWCRDRDGAAEVVLVTPAASRAGWDWTKWLAHGAEAGAVNAVDDAGELGRVADGSRGPVIVVVDGLAVTAVPPADPGRAVVTLVVGADGSPPCPTLDGTATIGLHVVAGRVHVTGRPSPAVAGPPVADGVSVGAADVLARRALRSRSARTGPDPALPGPLSSAGDPDVDAIPLRARAPRPGGPVLRTVLGTDRQGRAVVLDLEESARGGHGPHGLVVGATGSGKSELLRTLLMGLVVGHGPDELNLVLIDFKGGATFRGLRDLPHTAAVITNLEQDAGAVERMHQALAGELARRQRLLRDAGDLADVHAYARARAAHCAGGDLDPLPRLFVVCDEFTELIGRHPELAELFAGIGRVGRSLGVHLLVASQRLDEGRLRGLETHLSYRIALKTRSAAESRAVIGIPDAADLPATPGAAWLAHDGGRTAFATTYVSGPWRPRERPDPAKAAVGPFRLEPRRPPGVPAGDSSATTLVDAVVRRLRGHACRARAIWLPELERSPTAADLVAAGPPRPRAVALGLVDRPFEQRREPLWWDLGGASGHLAVVGGPRTGKSTALAAAIAGLALTTSWQDLQIHVVDLGGGLLAGLAGLPHVGTVAGPDEPELVERVVRRIDAIVGERESDAHRGAPRPEVVLVVDGAGRLRTETDELDAVLTRIAARGLSHGVHVAVAVSRWAELRAPLRDALGTRVELRLGDPAESGIDRRRAAALPTDRPGCGLAPDGARVRLAEPWSRDDGPDALLRRFGHPDDVPGVAPIRLLPSHVELGAPELVAGGPGVVLGLGDAGPVVLDPGRDPHLVVFADPGWGRTTLLRTVCRGLVRHDPDRARVLVVDYRRTLLGEVPDSHLAGYAAGPDALRAYVDDLVPVLQGRLPPADLPVRQLRDRRWWSGPDVHVLVDDYDLVAEQAGNPLLGLVPLLAQAADVGLHLVLCRRSGGAARALYDPVLQRLRELAAPCLVGSGRREEGPLAGDVRPEPRAPGRGVLVDGSGRARVVQVAVR